MAEIFSVIWPVNADPGEVTRADDGCAVSRCGSAVPGQRTVPGWFVRFTGRILVGCVPCRGKWELCQPRGSRRSRDNRAESGAKDLPHTTTLHLR